MIGEIAFSVLGIGLFMLLGVLAFRHSAKPSGWLVGVMGILLIAGSIAMLFGNAAKFETLKLTPHGMEAKTRELEGVLSEAKATVASLRELAKDMAMFQVNLLAGLGRFGGAAAPWKDGMKDRLLEQLKMLGLSDADVHVVETADKKWVLWDYAFSVLKPLRDPTNKGKSDAYIAFFKARSEAPTPDECASLLEKFDIDTKNYDMLTDYRYYYETGTHRRPDVWRNRDNWER